MNKRPEQGAVTAFQSTLEPPPSEAALSLQAMIDERAKRNPRLLAKKAHQDRVRALRESGQ